MQMKPEISKIDCMLSEYKALCYLFAFGKTTISSVDEYKKELLQEIANLTEETTVQSLKINDYTFVNFSRRKPHSVRWDLTYFPEEPPTNKALVDCVKGNLKKCGWNIDIINMHVTKDGQLTGYIKDESYGFY